MKQRLRRTPPLFLQPPHMAPLEVKCCLISPPNKVTLKWGEKERRGARGCSHRLFSELARLERHMWAPLGVKRAPPSWIVHIEPEQFFWDVACGWIWLPEPSFLPSLQLKDGFCLVFIIFLSGEVKVFFYSLKGQQTDLPIIGCRLGELFELRPLALIPPPSPRVQQKQLYSNTFIPFHVFSYFHFSFFLIFLPKPHPMPWQIPTSSHLCRCLRSLALAGGQQGAGPTPPLLVNSPNRLPMGGCLRRLSDRPAAIKTLM